MYGRQLLKTKLRVERPDLRVSMLVDAPEHEPLLDPVIDAIGAREWRQPITFSERVAAIRLMLITTLEISESAASARNRKA
jgi:hypothetical protein